MRHRTRTFAVAAMVALLGACGDTARTPSEGTPPPAPQTLQDYQLAFFACIREHGVDVPDPDAGGGIRLAPGVDDAAFTAAVEACETELGEPPAGEGDPATDEERTARHLKMTACLREHGVQVPDTKPGETMTLPLDIAPEVMEACGLDLSGGTGR